MKIRGKHDLWQIETQIKLKDTEKSRKKKDEELPKLQDEKNNV